jgi:hypothetical protein
VLLCHIVPDHDMPRGQALAGIGEALQKSAERLRVRGFQTRMANASVVAAQAIQRIAWLYRISSPWMRCPGGTRLNSRCHGLAHTKKGGWKP